jgi:protocadherin-16/23
LKKKCKSLFQVLIIFAGEIRTCESLDREMKAVHELVLEARDQGTPFRTARVPLKIIVMDINDNIPEIVDPSSDMVSVREEQPTGTDVAQVRAFDMDDGVNASITYTILEGTYILLIYLLSNYFIYIKLVDMIQ